MTDYTEGLSFWKWFWGNKFNWIFAGIILLMISFSIIQVTDENLFWYIAIPVILALINLGASYKEYKDLQKGKMT